jgi:Flp pilus assembly protein TadG
MHEANGSRKAATATRGKGFLTRLRQDTRGNALAIIGAALVPLAAMIGSGVDMSRAYMAKTRLQSACDAAALAARRVMQNDTLNATVTNEANRFFNFNFPQGTYDTTSFTPVVTRPSSGTVRVTASTRIPTAIMQLFGFDSLPLNVTCDASLNFVNTDVMLVLDVTGSMAENLGGTQKIVALRDAVMALYDELRPIQIQLEANGLRLRYGVVPYSSTVNVGQLIRAQNPDFLLDNVDYQSREARYDLATYVPDPDPPLPPVVQNFGQSISQSDCDKYGRNVSFSGGGGFGPSATTGGGPPPTATWTRSFSNNEASGVDWGWSGAPDTSGTTRTCRRRYVQTNTQYETRYRYNGTNYVQENVDVSQYKLGNSIQIASLSNSVSNDGNVANDGYVTTPGSYDAHELATLGQQITLANVTWNGCIEERKTVDTITTSSGYTIPQEAWDLNINAVPTADPDDDNLRWRPMFPQIVYNRTAGSLNAGNGTSLANAACPAPARRLQAWLRADMLSYVNALQPTGSTYHDTGMIWGARMISSGGIFADSPDNFNAMPVSRHIIFMSDGQMDTDRSIYTLYGIEQNDQRISGMATPSESELNGRHMQRFQMVCNAARGMNVSIWVIAFGTTLSPEMQACATNANQASTVGNRDQLIARFRQIGSNIGALRLTQ